MAALFCNVRVDGETAAPSTTGPATVKPTTVPMVFQLILKPAAPITIGAEAAPVDSVTVAPGVMVRPPPAIVVVVRDMAAVVATVTPPAPLIAAVFTLAPALNVNAPVAVVDETVTAAELVTAQVPD